MEDGIIPCLHLHFLFNPITRLNNDIITSLFGTFFHSVSISTFVQIPNQLNSYLKGLSGMGPDFASVFITT